MGKIKAFFIYIIKIANSMKCTINYRVINKNGTCIITGLKDTKFISLRVNILLKIFKLFPLTIVLNEILIGQKTVNTVNKVIKVK